ncbi:DeoR family transcriptional regulator [Serratia symbiotica]|uniref:DeoR family transcriptional regulator n=1 Tax=Serratia symbiotica TaxID=138074 RepID=UPI00077B8D8D|nr:DeoR family transcriptional regulator [Serratia symbiotica]USS95723.1 DeoR family transcriptional regulator [Serratia symbiotica]
MTECQRHNAILNLLPRQEQISVADVIAVFNISPTTTLRDINKPNEIGKLRQARNGAEAT